MKPNNIYGFCWHCKIIEKVSPYVTQIIHRHDGAGYILSLHKSKKDAYIDRAYNALKGIKI